MPLHIVRNDITKMPVDAIVNAANHTLLGGGGVDGAIHRAAGPALLEECRTLGGCETGHAKITGGYRLPSRYVIHTVGPVWHGGTRGEENLLASCYRTCLTLAMEKGCESVAFPLISAGAYGYPKDQALRVALDNIEAFLLEHELEVYLVVYGKDSFVLGKKLFADIQEYIDDHYVKLHPARRGRTNCLGSIAPPKAESYEKARPATETQIDTLSLSASYAADSLDDLMDSLDESFQQMLLRKIDESGMTDALCYKKANIDRKLFSKIRKDVNYKPSKATAIAFAVSLELDLSETESLLRKAGYALSNSNKADVIVRFFIERGQYDVFQINEALFYYDQNLLGA